MVFNSNKGFFLTLDDAAAPATLELPQQEAPATEDAPVEAAVVAASEPSVVASLQPPKLLKRPLQKPALHPVLSPQPHSPQQKRSPLNWLQQRQPAQK